MKRINKFAALFLMTLAAMNSASVAAAVNFPVGTHIYKGTLKDWRNKVLTSSASVTIQAVTTNGTVIASTKVADPTADGYNFLLQIPLSSTATEYTAAVGDQLNCVLVQDSGLSIAVEPLKVGYANTVSTGILAFVDMKSYASTNGTDTASVPQEYVDTIAVWMESCGIEGDYDPFDDYDGDRVSNYDEYRAGTNPFDATDKLAITAYAAPQNAPHVISFEYVGGHVYGVATTRSLVNPEWTTQLVKKSETDVEHDQVMPSADEDDADVATVYVVPAEGAASQFFKVEAK
ncbi:MAG: hypothetical protein IJ829_03725 [Kiritimatiellae bacterium]|nr:hypothetical protein [Kiritimatiellia bacterium]MBR1921101.1 hypothetical protein [Kiritimatiellia bacterium]